MTGEINELFQNFQVTVPEKMRYWEDDSTGVMIKRGQIVTIGPRQFRSAELRFALLRSQVLMKEGQCTFAFRDKLVKILPGENKNIVIDIENNIESPKEIIIEKQKLEEVKETSKISKLEEVKETSKIEIKTTEKPKNLFQKKERNKQVIQEEENGKEIGQYITEQFM